MRSPIKRQSMTEQLNYLSGEHFSRYALTRHSLFLPFFFFAQDVLLSTDLSVDGLATLEQERTFLCPSTVEYARPLRAVSARGEWSVVVNDIPAAYDRLTQVGRKQCRAILKNLSRYSSFFLRPRSPLNGTPFSSYFFPALSSFYSAPCVQYCTIGIHFLALLFPNRP